VAIQEEKEIKFNGETEEEEEKKIKKDKAEKSLETTNWIKNIRIQRQVRKKQMREMRDLKIDKNYLPEITNEFHLDPKDCTYKINPKKPENFVEIAKQAAEQKIAVNEPEKTENSENRSGSDSFESRSDSSSYSNSADSSDNSKKSENSNADQEANNEIIGINENYGKSFDDSNKNKMSISAFSSASAVNIKTKFPNANLNFDINLNKEIENFAQLNLVNNLYDLNVLNSNDIEYPRKVGDTDFDFNTNNHPMQNKSNTCYAGNITTNLNGKGNLHNSNMVDSGLLLEKSKSSGLMQNISNDNKSKFLNSGNNSNNINLQCKSGNSGNLAELSYRSDYSSNPETNNMRNIQYINGSSGINGNKEPNKVKSGGKNKANEAGKDSKSNKQEQPNLNAIMKSKIINIIKCFLIFGKKKSQYC
jgi:hypothetical protein